MNRRVLTEQPGRRSSFTVEEQGWQGSILSDPQALSTAAEAKSYHYAVKVEGVMTEKKIIRQAIKRKFPAIGLDDTLATAIDTMTKANESVLAVKTGDEIVGLVTVTDIMSSLAREHDLEKTKVSSCMTECEADVSRPTRHPCLQLDENDEAISAIKLMYDTGVNHLVVSGSNGKIVGIVSSLELIELFRSSAS